MVKFPVGQVLKVPPHPPHQLMPPMVAAALNVNRRRHGDDFWRHDGDLIYSRCGPCCQCSSL